MGCSSGAKSGGDSKGNEADTISLASALAIAEEEDALRAGAYTTSIEEMYRMYADNNEKATDPGAGCNLGKEPLLKFVDSFLANKDFRKSRLSAASRGVFYTDTLRPYTLRVIAPDSTGFFAGWNYVAADTAMFLSGWLNSEVLEEITLVRQSEEQEWLVTDYYSSI